MFDIKIRAWDKKKKRMIHDLICFYSPASQVPGRKNWGISHSNEFNSEKGYMWDFRNLIPMLKTGLKDKNGEEVFEKDILRWGFGDWYGVVIYKEGAFWITNEDGLPNRPLGDYKGRYEVIGNIYECTKEIVPKRAKKLLWNL